MPLRARIPLSVTLVAALAAAGCVERAEPPGAGAEPAASGGVVAAAPSGSVGGVATGAPGAPQPGSPEDNLPFSPDGTRIASTAWRNWVYSDVGRDRTRYGYLRAGQLVDVRGPAIVNDGCDGGWYRVNPRGFVCVGKGATRELGHPVVVASAARPVRGHGLPYTYAMSTERPPLLYFRLASKDEIEKVEGEGALERAARFRALLPVNGLAAVLGDPGAPPEFLGTNRAIEKPYGVERKLHLSVHAGRAAVGSGFAMAHVFTHEGRIWGLTTELDIIALDATKVVRPSTFRGVELGEGETLPVAFIESHFAQRYKVAASGQITADGSYRHREGVKLTGQTRGGGGTFHETRDGYVMAGEGARIISARDSFPSFATGTRKWIDISIREQSLVAYLGTKPVYATLVSTGRGGLGDPDKVQSTARGTFMVYQKHVTATMDGEEDKSDGYALLDVPFVQYFHKGYALHGTYWHDEFGKVRSHGCVNLSPIDSAWLFEWTDPSVPAEWHGVLNKDRGTVVLVRP